MTSPFAKAKAIAERFRHLDRAAVKPLVKAGAAGSGTAEMFIYEQIGADFWSGGGITGKSVSDALNSLSGVKTLNIYINSEGGDVFEAKAIYSSLKRFAAEKVVHIDGIAASAATFIAMAGDKIITSPVATWMVHQAWTVAMGPAAHLRATADLLDLENQTIAETYARRTGGSVEKMAALMAATTWMNAETALELGFTDEVLADDSGGDDEDAPASKKTSTVVALSELTQARLRGTSTAQRLAARLAPRTNPLPGQPGPTRNGQP